MPLSHEQPTSSGSTIPLSTPTVEMLQDEGYQTNLEGVGKSQTPAFRTRQSSATPATLTDTSENGLEVLAGDAKRLIQGIQKLRHLGIEEFVLPLPKICVVGDQSTGKSSLIEGMSEIKVPRKAGTCTRCPIEINLAESAHPDSPWECKVYLHKKYFFEGSKSKSIGVSRNRPLGPWIPKEPEDHHFATVMSKDAVGDVLHWAQLATLNPSKSPECYKPGINCDTPDTPETLQVKFSPNCVRVEISGPSLPNLSFYDLPGVINVAEAEEEGYLVKLVKNLVREYIKADNCINLLALPMTADAANSTAAEIVREEKAQGRTLGVLTKPDRVQPGESLEQWTSILNGGKFPLGYGYHVIKNNPDPTVDHATARAEEVDFFNHTEPYATQLNGYKSRFGTLQLQTALSQRLTAQILTSLPRINSNILAKAAAVDQELSGLPKPPAGNLPLVIHSRIVDFSRDLQQHIDGGSPDVPFSQNWHELAQDLRKRLADSRPVLSPKTPTTQEDSLDEAFLDSSSVSIPVFTVESDSDNPGAETPSRMGPAASRKRGNGKPATPIPQKRIKTLADIPQYQSQRQGKSFTLIEIRNIMKAAYVGLPGEIDPRVTERMSKTSMLHWEHLVTEFLHDTRVMCQQLVSDRVTESFSLWRQTPLYEKINRVCEAFLDRFVQQQRVLAKRSLRMELRGALTFNDEGMKQSREKALQTFQNARLQNRISEKLDVQETQNGKPTTGQARKEKMAKFPSEKLGPDPFEAEVSAMARVRAYYECAFSRLVDVVGQGIKFELFSSIRNELRRELTTELGLESSDANERCAILLAVNPEIEERRLQLKKEQAALQEAREWLQTLAKDVPNVDCETGMDMS